MGLKSLANAETPKTAIPLPFSRGCKGESVLIDSHGRIPIFRAKKQTWFLLDMLYAVLKGMGMID